MNSVNQILQQAIQLPEDQRLTLINRLLLVSETPASVDIKSAWDLEIRDRIARYDNGKTTSRPACDVFSDIDRQLKS